jgi:hypothetical protein
MVSIYERVEKSIIPEQQHMRSSEGSSSSCPSMLHFPAFHDGIPGAQGLLLDLEIYASQPNNSGQAVRDKEGGYLHEVGDDQ